MRTANEMRTESLALGEFARAVTVQDLPAPPRIALRPDDMKNGLGKLVLTLIELLRELLERQALRRIEAGSLTEPEIERLGVTFLQLAEQMEHFKRAFGLDDADLNLDLGPLGKLL